MIAGKPKFQSMRTAALFAYAAGATGVLANLLLVAFFALRAGTLGTANDLVGALGTAFMIPVALALGASLPDRRLGVISQVVGLSAMAVLTAGGLLLAFGTISFETQSPVALGAWAMLSVWLLLVNRWSRLFGVLPFRLTRLGESLGTLVLAAGAIAGLGLLLPWTSWPQLALFGAGGVLAAIGMLGTPFWFLFLGRHLMRS